MRKRKTSLKIIIEPCTKSISELLEEFRNLDKEELFYTFNNLRKLKDGNNIVTSVS